MEWIGYFLAILIGLSLGLVGSGGSILTVPVLVYLFQIPPTLATSYSLFVVGSTSFIGFLFQARQKMISFKAVLLLGIPSLVTVLLIRQFILPIIPDQLLEIGAFVITKSATTMILFALLMLGSSVSMLTGNKVRSTDPPAPQMYQLLAVGVGLGLVTGFLGAGGGFLIVPALVVLFQMPIRKAIGTSLTIICINTLIGFVGDVGHVELDWPFLLTLVSITVTGYLIGAYLSKFVSSQQLKRGFGWFVLTMGIYIISRELF
jgi:uncharacterized membrane protein YfcA